MSLGFKNLYVVLTLERPNPLLKWEAMRQCLTRKIFNAPYSEIVAHGGECNRKIFCEY